MHNDDKLERQLDAALSEYLAEPRQGLEQRILAHVRLSEGRKLGFRWAVALGAAACALVVMIISVRPSPKAIDTAQNVPAVVQQPTVKTPTTQARAELPTQHAKHAVRVAKHRLEPLPKLAQFPTPSPLTDEERALFSLARGRTPEKLQLLAEAKDAASRPITINELTIKELTIAPLNGGN